MKEKIINILQNKIDLISKQKCTLTDEELLNVVNNILQTQNNFITE